MSTAGIAPVRIQLATPGSQPCAGPLPRSSHPSRDIRQHKGKGCGRNPSQSGRGLTFAIAPVWGSAGSASERLWTARNAGELGVEQEFEATARLETELGYGIGVPGTRGIVTPYAGLSLAEGSSRTYGRGRAGTSLLAPPSRSRAHGTKDRTRTQERTPSRSGRSFAGDVGPDASGMPAPRAPTPGQLQVCLPRREVMGA